MFGKSRRLKYDRMLAAGFKLFMDLEANFLFQLFFFYDEINQVINDQE